MSDRKAEEDRMDAALDALHLGRAILGLKRVATRKYHTQPTWALVADAFGLGSTYAKGLCRRYGIDPDQRVKPSRREPRP